jgi:N-acetylglucosaminyl-diphospho-decaprenol L-rhamnosyltransferase
VVKDMTSAGDHIVMTIDQSPTTKGSSQPEAKPPRSGVLVAIVNYCTAELTIDCLRSLDSEVARNPDTQVIVADNASPDGSGAAIAEAIAQNGWSGWARLLALPMNGGFAYGNNAAVRDHEARGGRARYVWLLNSDTIVRPDGLAALVSFMDANPSVGIAGSCLEDPDGTQQCSTFRFPSLLGELEGSVRVGLLTRLLQGAVVAPPPERRSMPYDWVSGASMLLRAEMLDEIGLMDEDYFLYFEETDYCRRASSHGWKCWFVPESRIVHLVGRSTGVTGVANQLRRRSPYWFESRRRYFKKNHGRLRAVGADVALATGILFNRCLSAAKIRTADFPAHFLRDVVHHSSIWPARRADSSDR